MSRSFGRICLGLGIPGSCINVASQKLIIPLASTGVMGIVLKGHITWTVQASFAWTAYNSSRRPSSKS